MLIKYLVVLGLILGFLPGLSSAQDPYVVGWFEYADPRSESTGLRTTLAEIQGVTSLPFQLADPKSFRPAVYDMIIFGSFSELHAKWNAFAQRSKTSIEAFIRQGGVLVVMNRYHKSDSDETRRKLSILPSGLKVTRGREKSDVWFANPRQLSLWEDFGKRKIRKGWYRIKGGDIAAKGTCALDAFEEWPDKFRVSAGSNSNTRIGEPFALHTDFGRGRLHLFQLTLDKFDGAKDAYSKELCRKFMRKLIEYGKKRPRRLNKTPVVTDVAENTRDEKTGGTTEPDQLKETLPDAGSKLELPKSVRVSLRTFVDLNRNGNSDPGEPPLGGLKLNYGERVVEVDASGRAELQMANDQDQLIWLETPAGVDLQAPWFRRFVAGGKDAEATFDFPLPQLPLDRQSRALVLVASLPERLTEELGSVVQANLNLVIHRQACDLVLLLFRGRPDATTQAFAEKLLTLAKSAASAIRFHWLQPGPQTEIPSVPGDFSFNAGGALFLVGPKSRQSLTNRQHPGAIVAIAMNSPSTELLRSFAERTEPLWISPAGVATSLGNARRWSAPDFVVSNDLAAPPRFLLVKCQDGEAKVRLVPEIEDGAVGSKIPVHPYGQGNLEDLIREVQKG